VSAHLLAAAHRHFTDMSAGDWAMTAVAAVVSLWTIWKGVRYAFSPGETEPDHVKRVIFDEGQERAVVTVAAALPPAPPGPRRTP
jgi:hypothetical protein